MFVIETKGILKWFIIFLLQAQCTRKDISIPKTLFKNRKTDFTKILFSSNTLTEKNKKTLCDKTKTKTKKVQWKLQKRKNKNIQDLRSPSLSLPSLSLCSQPFCFFRKLSQSQRKPIWMMNENESFSLSISLYHTLWGPLVRCGK